MWDDAAAPGRPFTRTPGFLALALLLVAGAAALGVVLGNSRAGDGLAGTDPSTAAGGGQAVASTGPQARLAALLPASPYRDCVSGEVMAGQDAALRCSSSVPGATTLLVRHFVDAATMQGDFADRYRSAYPESPCKPFPGGQPGAGVTSSWRGGALACYVNTDGNAVVLWEYTDQAVQVVAVRQDADSPALFQWWLRNGAVPLG